MDKTVNRRPLTALPLAVASGVLLALALPPRDVSILGWIAFVPLILAAHVCRLLTAAGCGLVATLTCALIASGRITDAAQFGNLFGVFGALALVLAFVAAVISVTSRFSPNLGVLLIACAGVTAELTSLWVFPVNVALSQYRNPAMLKLASITGIWGVSFLIWFVAASVVAAVARPKSAWPLAVVSLAVVVSGWIIKFPTPAEGPVLRVAAVQTPYARDARRLTRTIGEKASLVVWPEQRLDPCDGNPARAARESRLYVVCNVIEPRVNAKAYNSAYLYAPSGRIIGKQYKRFPFGDEIRLCARGPRLVPIDRGGFRAGMAVCFDTQFPVVARDLVRDGADIVLVPVHDPEMPSSLLNYLHGAIAPFRAAENGVPIVWADSKGLSMIVERSGQVTARAPARREAVVCGPVRLRTAITLANRFGDWFACLCAGAFLLGTVSALARRP